MTSFRRVGALHRRAVEVHRVELVDGSVLLQALGEAGFEAGSIPGYGDAALPVGVAIFRCRKPAGGH